MRFEDIRSQFEGLSNSLEAFVHEVGDLDEKDRIIQSENSRLADKLVSVERLSKEIEERREDVESERKYNAQTRLEQNIREDSIKKQASDLRTEIENLDIKKSQIESECIKLKELIATYKDLKDRESKLDEREAILEREKVVDSERKKIFDMKEKQIKNEQNRLQRLSEMI